MAIPAIGSVTSVVPPVPAAEPAAAKPVGDFSDALMRGLDGVQSSQNDADQLARAAMTGDLTDVHDYTIAATKASLMTELTVAVRNKAVDAFQEIMRMQI